MRKQFLIVGAGFTGCTISEQLAKKLDCHIDIIDQRNHTGGNCHTERDKETGIMVHKYGPHIFHTDKKYIWDYVNRFGKFNEYRHTVKAIVAGKQYSFPINLATINDVFDSEWTSAEAEEIIKRNAINPVGVAKNFEEQALAMIGKRLYEMFFYGYTKKQWGCEPKELPASIIKRIPLRFNYNDWYHSSEYSGIPVDGYTAIMKKMISNPNINLMLNEKFSAQAFDLSAYDHIFYTGPIDEFFSYSHGRLGYRTVEFKNMVNPEYKQGFAQANYCDESVEFTRVVEHKHLAPWEKHEQTILTTEYSKETGEKDIPYYPKRLATDMSMLNKYQADAGELKNVSFVGRLATYRYLDMHNVIADALHHVEYFINNLKQ